MGEAWSPPRVPDISDPAFGSAVPNPGAVIAPSGIATAEAFGTAVVSVSSVIEFVDYFTAANILQAVQSDIGITITGGKVSLWADQTPNTPHDFSQATAGARPVMGSSVNGFASVLFDGVDDFLSSTLDTPAPLTTTTFMWAVYRIVSAPAGNVSMFGGTNFGQTVNSDVLRNSVLYNNVVAVSSNSGSAAGGWGRMEGRFSNTVNDYLKFGANAGTTGTACGNGASTGRCIGGNTTSGYANIEVLAYVLLDAVPSAPQLAAASAAVTAKYGGTVAI